MTPLRRILTAIPTRGMVSSAWALSLRSMKSPDGTSVDVMEDKDAPIDHMRNRLVMAALEGNYDSIFFLDDDVLLPPLGLCHLWSRNLDIVSGLYMRRHEPIRPLMMMDTVEEGEPAIRAVMEFPVNALMNVGYVGAGCLLIKTDVFRKVEKPWFKWMLSDENVPVYERLPEDLYFCKAARSAGYKIHMDTGVRCLHVGIGRVDVLGEFRPVEVDRDAVVFGVGAIPRSDSAAVGATK